MAKIPTNIPNTPICPGFGYPDGKKNPIIVGVESTSKTSLIQQNDPNGTRDLSMM